MNLFKSSEETEAEVKYNESEARVQRIIAKAESRKRTKEAKERFIPNTPSLREYSVTEGTIQDLSGRDLDIMLRFTEDRDMWLKSEAIANAKRIK